ncbi:hypothetical protein QA601_13715 [Chitinispirillales bacterium ANBcel5]|nr:hypothetical protein [Chitinispirillales bacterium ANBcel5]
MHDKGTLARRDYLYRVEENIKTQRRREREGKKRREKRVTVRKGGEDGKS